MTDGSGDHRNAHPEPGCLAYLLCCWREPAWRLALARPGDQETKRGPAGPACAGGAEKGRSRRTRPAAGTRDEEWSRAVRDGTCLELPP